MVNDHRTAAIRIAPDEELPHSVGADLRDAQSTQIE
jgi:hypothetical protein